MSEQPGEFAPVEKPWWVLAGATDADIAAELRRRGHTSGVTGELRFQVTALRSALDTIREAYRGENTALREELAEAVDAIREVDLLVDGITGAGWGPIRKVARAFLASHEAALFGSEGAPDA